MIEYLKDLSWRTVLEKSANAVFSYAFKVAFILWVIGAYGSLIIGPFGVYDTFDYDNIGFCFAAYGLIIAFTFMSVRFLQRPYQKSGYDSALIGIWMLLSIAIIPVENRVFISILKLRIDYREIVDSIVGLKHGTERPALFDVGEIHSRLTGRQVPKSVRNIFPNSPVSMEVIWLDREVANARILYGTRRSGLLITYHSSSDNDMFSEGGRRLGPNVKLKYPYRDF